jgi:hypothetical protein
MPRFWASGEYLLWWIRDSRVPPLVTSTLLTPAQIAMLVPTGVRPGALFAPGTVPVFGGGHLDNEEQSGGRFTVGLALPCCECLGFETTFMFLGQRTNTFQTSGGFLFRPFDDVLNPPQNAEIVSVPGAVGGGVRVNSTNWLWGIEPSLRTSLCCGCNYHIDLLGGFRYLELRETLNISENPMTLTAIPFRGDVLPAGSAFLVSDGFATRNQFFGGQLGLDGEYRYGRWLFFGASAKLALGSMHQAVDVAGTTAATVGGVTTVAPAGFLALGSNSGHFSRDRFAVVPEVGLKVGCQITDHLRATVGYSFLYVSSVVRPGDQIDTTINTSQLPRAGGVLGTLVGPARPLMPFNTTSYWAQGFNFGLEYKY